MAQPRSREARTALPAVAGAPGADAPVVGQPARATDPGLVTLADGSTVKLRRLSGLDSCQLEQTMVEAGFVSMSGPGQATFLRCAACFAIIERNGQLQTPPQSASELKSRLAGHEEGDWATLVTAYLRLIGAVKDDATFRQSD